jgi:hypothetical protein
MGYAAYSSLSPKSLFGDAETSFITPILVRRRRCNGQIDYWHRYLQ